jgi:hypothetical protein
MNLNYNSCKYGKILINILKCFKINIKKCLNYVICQILFILAFNIKFDLSNFYVKFKYSI